MAILRPSSAKQQKGIHAGSKAVTSCIYKQPLDPVYRYRTVERLRHCICDCLRLHVLFLFHTITPSRCSYASAPRAVVRDKVVAGFFKPALLCSSVDTLLPCQELPVGYYRFCCLFPVASVFLASGVKTPQWSQTVSRRTTHAHQSITSLFAYDL